VLSIFRWPSKEHADDLDPRCANLACDIAIKILRSDQLDRGVCAMGSHGGSESEEEYHSIKCGAMGAGRSCDRGRRRLERHEGVHRRATYTGGLKVPVSLLLLAARICAHRSHILTTLR